MDNITIFWNKENGKIMNVTSGEQNYELFTDSERDQAMLRYDILIVEKNEDIMSNPRSYMVTDNQVVKKEVS